MAGYDSYNRLQGLWCSNAMRHTVSHETNGRIRDAQHDRTTRYTVNYEAYGVLRGPLRATKFTANYEALGVTKL